MALVKNSVVKMEWEQSGWLARRYRNSMTSAFIFASNPHTENEDIWKAKELKDWYKAGNADYSFPINYEEYVPVIDSGNLWCNEEVLKEYGIEGYKYDIEARLKDVMPYGEESYTPLY